MSEGSFLDRDQLQPFVGKPAVVDAFVQRVTVYGGIQKLCLSPVVVVVEGFPVFCDHVWISAEEFKTLLPLPGGSGTCKDVFIGDKLTFVGTVVQYTRANRSLACGVTLLQPMHLWRSMRSTGVWVYDYQCKEWRRLGVGPISEHPPIPRRIVNLIGF